MYQLGLKLESEGQLDQAIREFENVVALKDATLADEAHVEIAKCQEKKGAVFLNRAVDNLQAVDLKSNMAAEASFRLGKIFERRDFVDFDLKEACRYFARVFDVYPGDPWADEALYEAGLCLMDQYDWLSASQIFIRLIQEHPLSQVVGQAWMTLGACFFHTGDVPLAMETFHRGLEVTGADEGLTQEALGINSLLFRFYFLSPSGQDLAFKSSKMTFSESLKKPSSIVCDGSKRILVLDNVSRAVWSFSLADGKRLEDFPLANKGEGLFTGPQGTWLVSCGESVVINGRSQILSPPKPDIYTDPPPFKGIQWTVMNSTGEIFLGTSGGKKLTHFDPQHNPMNAAFPSEEIGKYMDVALDASGRVCLLLESGGTLARFAPDGSQIDQADLKGLIPSLGEVRKMRTDFLGHFYLLDGKKNTLYVLSTDLKLVTQLNLGALGIGRAGDVALDGRGGIYLLDELNACVFRLE